MSQSISDHTTLSSQLINTMTAIRKLIQRTNLGTEKSMQLAQELFAQGGNLALIMGEFVLAERGALSNCSSQQPVIGFVKRGSDYFFEDMGRGIRKEAEQYGFQVIETNSRYEATTQVEDVNWLLKHPGLRGIILCPVDLHVAHKLVQKSLERRILCVAADESLPLTISVRSGNREGGRRAAELFRDHLPEHAQIGVLVDRTAESIVRRLEGFRQQAEQDGYEMIEIYCDISHPDQLDSYLLTGIEEQTDIHGLFLTNEKVTTAYLDMIHNGKLPVSRYLAVGYDQTPEAEKAIQAGELLGAIFQHPQEIGRQAFQYLQRLLSQELRIEDLEEHTIYIPTMKATKETLSQRI